MEIRNIIKDKEYNFLRTDVNISDKLCLLTFGGSHAYGTNVEGSDIDIRGICLNAKKELIGLERFDQKVEEKTDTTVYAFNKFIKLIMNCNPNTIELLFTKPETQLILNDIGKELIENREWFLTQRAIYSFGGYANQQLRRLDNALAHDNYSQIENEKHILNSVERMIEAHGYKEKVIDSGIFNIGTKIIDGKNEIVINGEMKDFPLRDYNKILENMRIVQSQYDKLNHRNNKKDNLHLQKHCMHLVRLFLMAFDILENGTVETYREKDREFLLQIRNGEHFENGKPSKYLMGLIGEYKSKLDTLKDTCKLPKSPNYKKVNDWVISVNERIIKGDIKQYENI